MADPIVFTQRFRVPLQDIDQLDHVSNVTIVRYVQDIAAAHWLSIAPAESLQQHAWVVRRHEIDYLRQLFLNEELTLRTWVGAMSGASWDRHTEIIRSADQTTVVRARTVWVLIDPTSGRPRRVDPNWAEWLKRTPQSVDE